MGQIANNRFFMCDFETTVYTGQKVTEVWASACVELFTEDVEIYHSIDELFDYIFSLDCNTIWYFHNLKFDGSFVLSYLMVNLKLEQAICDGEWLKFKNMINNTFKYSISAMGQWYTITIKYKGHKIEIRDSLKLLPFSVKKIGDSFGTKHRKMEMEYKGYRYAGCQITEQEKEYIRNDVLVVKEALEIMFRDGHDKLTIGSCCLSEFKRCFDKKDYMNFFPNLYKIELNRNRYDQPTVGDYIHTSYRGGWCYLVKGKEGKIYHNGTTADVNSLYPSVMHSVSGNYYPVGQPHMWYGNYIPESAKVNNRYYFVRIKTKFYLKDGYLPFIQIKRNKLYKSTDSLITSDVFYNGKYYEQIKDNEGNIKETFVSLTLTMTDFELIQKHYMLKDMEIISGCWFYSEIGLFDKYIDKYKKIKQESEGAVREEAKLFLNNLYGKMASSTDSSFKLAYVKEDESLGFRLQVANDKTPGYIPIGSAITSYARNFTINAAQLNYHGVDEAGFIYADTDSIHCDLQPDEIVGIEVHKNEFYKWSLECNWDEAIFTRQKTYIEHVTHKDCKPVKKPYYDIKCAGMPDRCKDYFNMSMQGYELTDEEIEDKKLTNEEVTFIRTNRTIIDFKKGLKVPGKLLPFRMKGGIVLHDTTYEMR